MYEGNATGSSVTETSAPNTTSFMTEGRATILRRLSRSLVLGWVACVILLLQVALAADHLGASAARAAGASQVEAVGLLALCHGEGDDQIASSDTPSDRQSPGAVVPPCILCSVAHLGATGVAPSAPVIALADAATETVEAAPESTPIRPVRSPLRYGTERGPPPSSIA